MIRNKMQKTEHACRDIYWRHPLHCSYDVRRMQMDPGYPRLISWDYRGVGSRVDAVFENYGKKLYFCLEHRTDESLKKCQNCCSF